MACRRLVSRCLIVCVALTLASCLYLALYPIQDMGCSCPASTTRLEEASRPDNTPVRTHDQQTHSLGIIVPLRDRFEELMEFVPHMTKFLTKQGIKHKILAINQVDNYRFNRASLINIGYLEAEPTCDYIAMHDVDLLPLNPNLRYSYPSEGPLHVAAPELHPLYHYKTFVGGILLLKTTDFKKLNGMSNRYWGWGREDDEFYVRMKKAGFVVQRPQGITTGNQTFRHIHDRRRRPRDNKRFFDQRNKTRRLDRETGIASVKYEVDSRRELTVDGAPVTIVNVNLRCDVKETPWCLHPEDHEWYLKQISASP